jgi:preprotein translocase subunit SecG
MSHLEWVLVGFAIIAFAAVAVVVGVLLTRDRGADSHNEPGVNQRAGFSHQRGSVPGSSSKDKNR